MEGERGREREREEEREMGTEEEESGSERGKDLLVYKQTLEHCTILQYILVSQNWDSIESFDESRRRHQKV